MLFFNINISVFINVSISSLTLNEIKDHFIKPFNRVSLETNLSIKTYAILTLLRAPVFNISI